MPKVKVRTTQNIDLEYEIAHIGLRIGAFLLDLLVFAAVMGIYFLIVRYLFDGFSGESFGRNLISGIGMFLVAISYVFYDLLCETIMHGQSFGKKLMKIKVIRLDGTHPKLGDFVIRWLLRIADVTMTMGALATFLIAFGEKGQRLGDMAAGTSVISLRTEPTFEEESLYNSLDEVDYEIVYPQVANLTDKDMQLIKNVLTQADRSDNPAIINQLAKKLQAVLKTEVKHPPRLFINTVVRDYNHMNSGFDEGELF